MMGGTVLRASASSCSIISSPRRLSIFQKRLGPSPRFGISHQLIVPLLPCPLPLARISLPKQKLSVIRLLTVSGLSSSASSPKSLMSSCLLPALSSSFLGTRIERPSPSSGRRRRGPNPTSHRYLKASVDLRLISNSSDRCCRTTRGVIIGSRSMETEKTRGKIECHSSSQSGGGDQPVSSSVLPPRPTRSKAKGLAISFCPRCGGATEEKIPVGENEMRFVCTRCGAVHYQNPKMVVGCLVEHEEKVLLCRRNIEPSYGLWTLPAGYMEIGESAAEGAARETLEEACADVQVIGLFALLDIPFIGQSYIIFRAQMKNPHFAPGPESLECALFKLNEIPFESLAFSSIHVALKMYIEDVEAGRFKVHHGVIDKRPGAGPSDLKGFVVRNVLLS